MSSVSHRGLTHLGMDVHKDSISIGILAAEDDAAEVDKIFHDEASVRRFIARFPEPRRWWRVTRRDRRDMSFTGCWCRWDCGAR